VFALSITFSFDVITHTRKGSGIYAFCGSLLSMFCLAEMFNDGAVQLPPVLNSSNAFVTYSLTGSDLITIGATVAIFVVCSFLILIQSMEDSPGIGESDA
jgi:hypothetical protein